MIEATANSPLPSGVLLGGFSGGMGEVFGLGRRETSTEVSYHLLILPCKCPGDCALGQFCWEDYLVMASPCAAASILTALLLMCAVGTVCGNGVLG